MAYNTRDYRVSGLRPSPFILKNTMFLKLDGSILRWKGFCDETDTEYKTHSFSIITSSDRKTNWNVWAFESQFH
jgi:hypothetical protein